MFFVDFKDAKKTVEMSISDFVGLLGRSRRTSTGRRVGGGSPQLRVEETEIRIEETKSEVTGI